MSKDYRHMHETLYRGYEAIKGYLTLAPFPEEVRPTVEPIKHFSLLKNLDLSRVAEVQENYEDAKALLKVAHRNLERYIEKHNKPVILPEMSSVMVADKMIERYEFDLNIALKGLNHLTAQAYLEQHIEELDKGKIDAIGDLSGTVYQSANVLIGLRDAIESCAKESDQRDIKLILFLENFYDRAPICGSYTTETHEKNFKAAVHGSSYSLGDVATVLGEVYSGYLSDESIES